MINRLTALLMTLVPLLILSGCFSRGKTRDAKADLRMAQQKNLNDTEKSTRSSEEIQTGLRQEPSEAQAS